MNYTDAKLIEIDRNLARFLQLLPELMADHAGQYALLRQESVVAYFSSAIDAQIAGNQRFDDRMFSIQQVAPSVAESGRFSYAVG